MNWIRRVLVCMVVLIVAWAISVGLASRGGSPSRPPAPKVGDSCTNNGSTFTYNDGGPGYIEQTAFGLTCQ